MERKEPTIGLPDAPVKENAFVPWVKKHPVLAKWAMFFGIAVASAGAVAVETYKEKGKL